MKRIYTKLLILIITILIIGCSQVVHTQDYKPLAIDGATWIIGYAPEIWEDTDLYAYHIEGDSTLNNVNYKKVYRYDLADDIVNPYIILSKEFFALIREINADRKVFVHTGAGAFIEFDTELCVDTWTTQEELLLIDFDKNIGDTITDCIVDSLDHVTIELEQYEMRYGTDRQVWTTGIGLELIEGIGYEDGLFVKATSIEHAGWGHTLFDYCQGTLEACGLITADRDMYMDESIEIFPNPASDILYIRSDKAIDGIDLFNYNGQLVLHSVYGDLNTKDLPSGIYMLRLRSGSQFLSKVVAINH